MQSGETQGCPFVGDDSIMRRTYKSAPNAQNGHGTYYQRNLAEVALAYLQEGGTVRRFVMTLRAAARERCQQLIPCPAGTVGHDRRLVRLYFVGRVFVGLCFTIPPLILPSINISRWFDRRSGDVATHCRTAQICCTSTRYIRGPSIMVGSIMVTSSDRAPVSR